IAQVMKTYYIDVRDDDTDDTPKLGVWILDGDTSCSQLLKFAIKSDNIENCLLILVASMTQPWSILTVLKKWTTIIEDHIDRLKLDTNKLRELRDKIQYDFQHYLEPSEATNKRLTTSATSTSLASSSTSATPTTSPATTQITNSNSDDQFILPLGEGVLTKNLGLPVIVVITKCDAMPTLEKENDYKDEQFDFIQHHIRKFCLQYGAALFYTSVKEKKNIDKLYKYIVHKCYNYPFQYSAAVVERDSIFIPNGWDNEKKIHILLENLHQIKPTDNYTDIIVKPIVRRVSIYLSTLITASKFITKRLNSLEKSHTGVGVIYFFIV
ncbi:unnamed protein product, partial [Didymodactylos carnosus]